MATAKNTGAPYLLVRAARFTHGTVGTLLSAARKRMAQEGGAQELIEELEDVEDFVAAQSRHIFDLERRLEDAG